MCGGVGPSLPFMPGGTGPSSPFAHGSLGPSFTVHGARHPLLLMGGAAGGSLFFMGGGAGSSLHCLWVVVVCPHQFLCVMVHGPHCCHGGPVIVQG